LMKNDPAMWDEQVKSLKRAGERLSGQRKRMIQSPLMKRSQPH